MKIAIITSNNISVGEDTKKGTEIVFKTLINNLVKKSKENNLEITAFASGDSDLPVKIESIDYHPTSYDPTVPDEKRIMFELALLSKAFSLQDKYDLYNIHIGDGDLVLPFANFVSKPILITMHHVFDKPYVNRYFSLFQNLPNVYFNSLSNYQRRFFPPLNFASNIYNAIETEEFKFDDHGGDIIMWSGRGDPIKGLSTAFYIVEKTKRKTKFFIIRKKEQQSWLEKTLELIPSLKIEENVIINFDSTRSKLVEQYQKSKLFLFPTELEEPCPLSVLEAMSCGTPVVAFARGSVPELIKDGKTGFIVNPSDSDTRGNWVIKKAGIEGLIEAIERIYSMNENEYLSVRKSCRDHIEENFSTSRMVNDYILSYKKIVNGLNDDK